MRRFASSSESNLRQLENRLALHDRAVVGEGVEGLDEKAAAAGFGVNVAHGAERDAAAGIERMHQALPLAVARELFVECPKHFRRDRLELKIRVIDVAAAALDAIASLPLEAIGE